MELDVLLEEKSKELKNLQEQKIKALNDEIGFKETQLDGLREQYSELKESFQYNLQLLAERDKELGTFDKIVTQLNERNDTLTAELSDVKVHLADAAQKIREEEAKREEVQRQFHNKVKEIEDDLQRQYFAKENKLSIELADTARIKQQLEINLHDLEEDSERKRREWERNFEEEINSLIREHSTRISENETKLFQSESKLKQVTSEREALRLKLSEQEEVISSQSQHITKMEEAVQNAEWDVNNYISALQARIAELEESLTKQADQNEERNKILSNKLQSQISEQQVVLETERQKTARLEVNMKMSEEDKESRVRDVRTELEMKKQDIARYKTEIALGVKREEAIRSEAEQELKLMKLKCENLERKAYSTQEELVKDLTYARDVALADAKRLKSDLLLLEDEIRILKGQIKRQDQTNTSEQSDGNDEVNALREQNARLKDVIKQMSSDIENIAAQNTTQNNTQEMRPSTTNANHTEKIIPETPTLLEHERESLRDEVMLLRRTITTLKNRELSERDNEEELSSCRSRLDQVEKERNRLLELSNSLRSQLNNLLDEQKKGVPLQEITSRLQSARSALSSNQESERLKRTKSGQSQFSLLHMSGDTSLNEELSDICRMVESEENRPLSAAGSQVIVTGTQFPPTARPSIPTPKQIIRGPSRRNVRPTTGQAKSKIRNYNVKT
ncbi:hypothetical protein ACHWQZ_G013265 [Mnemiopsis leidyi]